MNNYITVLTGSTFIKKYSLSPLTSGYFTNYSSISTGPVSNEFSTAAFRMGHSLVQGSVLYVSVVKTEYLSQSETLNEKIGKPNEKKPVSLDYLFAYPTRSFFFLSNHWL